MPRLAIDLEFSGTYSLASSASIAAAASFVDPPRTTGADDPAVLDLAFPLDGSWTTIGVRVQQDDSAVRVLVHSNPSRVSADVIRYRLEEMLSLDQDGIRFDALGSHDPVVADLLHRFPGVRPVLYPSPYEAAARAIIMHRISRRQATSVTRRISEEHGDAIDFGDHVVHAFPSPERLSEIRFVRGLSARKVDQLAVLGRTAIDGRLGREALRAMSTDDAMTHLQQLPGIGPFSAELIMIRGVGDPDVFPRTEKTLHLAMAKAYDLGEDPDTEILERVAARWRPFRSWIGLLFRHLVERVDTEKRT